MIHRETPADPAASSPPAADAGDAPSPAPARHALSDFLRRTLIVAAVAAGTVIVLAALWLEIRALLLGFAGVLVAVMLYRLSGIVSRWTRLPYWAALLAVGVGLLAISAGAAWLMADRIAAQVDSLQTQLPKAWEQLRATSAGGGGAGGCSSMPRPSGNPLQGAAAAAGSPRGRASSAASAGSPRSSSSSPSSACSAR